MLPNGRSSAVLVALVVATGLWVVSPGASIAQEERVKTSPEVLQRTPEQEKALRSEFMAHLKWLDDIAAQKEVLIQSYMDLSDHIKKMKSKLKSNAAAAASRGEGLDEIQERQILERGIVFLAATKLDRLIEYQLLVQREELEKSFQGKLIAKPDYLKELHALEDKIARNEQLRTWREMSGKILGSLEDIERDIVKLLFALPTR